MLGRLTPPQIEAILRRSAIGHIGVSADGKTYVVPITYVYDGDAVYGHTTVGQKVRMMRTNPDVCFEVDEIADMANWKTVIAQGRYEELSGDVAVAAAKLIAARIGPLTTSQTAGPSGRTRGRVPVSYRIRLRERTGRFERRAPKRRKGGTHG